MKKKLFALIAILLLSFSLTGCFRIIEDGEVGVKKTLGNYQDKEKGTGLKVFVPFISFIHVVNVKKQTIDEHASVPTSDGLMVDLDISVIYKIIGDRASEIKQTVTGHIEETLLIPYIRSGLRNTVSGYAADTVYKQESREIIEDELLDLLQTKLQGDIHIEDVLLRKVVMPDKIKDAIEAKLQAGYKIAQKENEKKTAVIDAEIAVEQAKGIAESNEIISNSITKEYLQYKFIENLAVAGADVIYVPTEANIPIMEAGRTMGIN